MITVCGPDYVVHYYGERGLPLGETEYDCESLFQVETSAKRILKERTDIQYASIINKDTGYPDSFIRQAQSSICPLCRRKD